MFKDILDYIMRLCLITPRGKINLSRLLRLANKANCSVNTALLTSLQARKAIGVSTCQSSLHHGWPNAWMEVSGMWRVNCFSTTANT